MPQPAKPPGKPPVNINIEVNEQSVLMHERKPTGLEIKQAAIVAGVRIEEDFILVEEIGQGGHTKIIGDQDEVPIKDGSRFTANDGDDDS